MSYKDCDNTGTFKTAMSGKREAIWKANSHTEWFLGFQSVHRTIAEPEKSPRLCMCSLNGPPHSAISAMFKVWSIAQIQGFSPFFSHWYVANDEIFNIKFAIEASIFLYDLLSGLAILQAINKNATFICISNWGESIKIKHFHFFLSMSLSVCSKNSKTDFLLPLLQNDFLEKL